MDPVVKKQQLDMEDWADVMCESCREFIQERLFQDVPAVWVRADLAGNVRLRNFLGSRPTVQHE